MRARMSANQAFATDAFDDEIRNVVAAFQRHFRPRHVDGIADPSTIRTLARLIGANHPAGTGT